jgi:hypothetical protein
VHLERLVEHGVAELQFDEPVAVAELMRSGAGRLDEDDTAQAPIGIEMKEESAKDRVAARVLAAAGGM